MKITTDRFTDFPENPDLVRWRAWWDWDAYGETLHGIELRCYPVIKVTPLGAWIACSSIHHGEWVLSGQKRWVSNDGGQAWAKPTKADALFSIAYRFSRWGTRLSNDINRYMTVAHALTELMPNNEFRVRDGVSIVRHAATCRDSLLDNPGNPT